MTEQNQILSRQTAEKKLRRMALEVAEKNYGKNELILIGIKDNGSFIARKIAAYLDETGVAQIKVIELSINKKNPGTITLSEPINFNNKVIILIDDVANSGRTMLYALKPLLEQLPHKIQTLALVERTHKQFPIAVDFVGISVSTTLQENIVVEIEENEVTGAWMR
ncbi:MAG: phosphoribosyltransferase family protein [Ferruginibacter sp.]